MQAVRTSEEECAPADRVRGECPGVHTPFLEADGALLRIRVPGGILTAAGLRAAGSCGGTLEITSRANLQLRGLDPDAVPAVAARLVGAGLALPDPARDERRNVLASPTAGFDATELVDVRDLTADLAALLAGSGRPEVSPKFGVLVDGGGAVSLRGRRHDICLGAVGIPGAAGVTFEMRLGEPLPISGRDAGPAIVVPAAGVSLAVETALALCPPGGRMADALATHGRDTVLRAVAERCGGTVGRPPTARDGAPAHAPIGLHEAAAHGPWRGTLWCGAAPLLGRLTGDAGRGLASLATEFGQGEIRLTPWRGVIVPGVLPAAAPGLVAALEGLGLSADRSDPLLRVVACAGSTGCHSGLTDTQADGARLVEHLRASSPTTHTVHLSGCPKGCASRDQADVTLVGGPDPGTYELYRRDPAAGGFGRREAARLGPDAALAVAGREESIR